MYVRSQFLYTAIVGDESVLIITLAKEPCRRSRLRPQVAGISHLLAAWDLRGSSIPKIFIFSDNLFDKRVMGNVLSGREIKSRLPHRPMRCERRT
jgi:hypothetical protein